LAAPQHVDGRSRVVSQPGGSLVAIAVGQIGDLRQHGGEGSAVGAIDQIDGAGGRGGVLGRGDAVRRRTWRQFALGAHVQR
jgi:hypothetical protein